MKKGFVNTSIIENRTLPAPPCFSHRSMVEWRQNNKPTGDVMSVEQFVMAHGASIGKTLPAYPEEVQTVYPRQDCTAQNAAAIPCRQVLGAYMVAFDRS